MQGEGWLQGQATAPRQEQHNPLEAQWHHRYGQGEPREAVGQQLPAGTGSSEADLLLIIFF